MMSLPKHFGLALYPGKVFRIAHRRGSQVRLEHLERDNVGVGGYVWVPSVSGTVDDLVANITKAPLLRRGKGGKRKSRGSGKRR